MRLLCELGGNRGIGFDPVYVGKESDSEIGNGVQFIRDFYSEQYSHCNVDFVCCKMTLEHIHQTAEFVRMIRKAIGDAPETIVFFQVPDVKRILREIAFWDVYYEHCSYFSKASLSNLFSRSGFQIIDLQTEYDNQYLTIAAIPADVRDSNSSTVEELEALLQDVVRFVRKYQEMVSAWRRRFEVMSAKGQRIVIWGASSKGVAFLNALDIHSEVQFAVDINPRKHDTFIAGTGQRIVAPSFLRSYDPNVVIVMNPIYRTEIQQTLEEMGVDAQILTT